MAAADPAAMDAQVKASPLFAKYAEPIDRESARERLAAKLEAGAAKAEAEEAAKTEPARKPAPVPRRPKPEKSMVEEVVTSTTFRQVMRTAAREIVRGVFKTGRR
jgi:hypothetical protein